MAARPLLWSPAHDAVLDYDSYRFHRLWCPDVREHHGEPPKRIAPEHALMWDDAPRHCSTCHSQSASSRAGAS